MNVPSFHAQNLVHPSTNEWNFHRERILQLYAQHSLQDVCAQMKSESGFNATPRMYSYRLKKWGISKKSWRARDWSMAGLSQPILSQEYNGSVVGMPNDTKSEPDELEKFRQTFEEHMPSSQSSKRHDSTAALLLSFDAEARGSLDIAKEVKEVEEFLHRDYNFDIAVTSTNEDAQDQVLDCLSQSDSDPMTRHKTITPQKKEASLESRSDDSLSAFTIEEALYSFDPLELRKDGSEQEVGGTRISSWSAKDDETLIQARAQGLNWNQIAPKHFPVKSANACRKRHERLMDRQNSERRDSIEDMLTQAYTGPETNAWSVNTKHGPQTDSGYGSAIYNEQYYVQRHTQCEDDSATIYSLESDSSSVSILSYINEFIKFLSESLGLEHSNIAIKEASYYALEDLLKSFALRLACAGNSPEISRCVAFVYRHRQQIAKTIREQFLEDADSPMSSPYIADGMNYLEKMDMWQSKDQEFSNPEDSQNEEEGALDYPDDPEEEMPEASIYRKLIEESQAYQWLLAQLGRQTGLSIDGLDARKAVRNSILCALPDKLRISRTSPTELIKARYNVLLDLIGFLEEQHYDEELSYALEHAITLTGSTSAVQAATCASYLKQTWPLTGECLIHVLKRAVQSRGIIHTTNAGDGSRLTALIKSRYLTITSIGSRDSIADVGEQLAWLGSAFQQGSADGEAKYYVAKIDQIRSRKPLLQGATDPSVEIDCLITFKMAQPEEPEVTHVPNGSCWHGLFRRPVIAKGFPILHRDQSEVGLEIPLSMMTTLAQAKRVTSFDGKVYAKGFSTVLFPTERSGDTIMWHLLYNENRERLTYNDPRIEPLRVASCEPISIKDLENSRHILGWASSTEMIAGASNANLRIRRSGFTDRGSGCILEKMSISAGKIANAGASFVIGARDIPVHLKREGSYIEQIESAYNNYVILYDVDDKRSWLVNGATALLYLVRASLHENTNDKFRSRYLFQASDLEEATITHTADSAIEVLTRQCNMELKITEDKAEIWTETSQEDDGSSPKIITKRKERFVYFQDRVDEKWHILEQLLDQQSKIAVPGVRLTVPGRQYLEGYDFTDVATRISDLEPKVTRLQPRGKGWIDFSRSIRAVTLFGRGFGELIRPSKDCANLCSCWPSIPTGLDYLAVSVSDLEQIASKRGDPDATPIRLVGDICWHQPGNLFEACRCREIKLKRKFSWLDNTCDRVQVLLPSTSRVPRFLNSPVHFTFDGLQKGAIIFGHSKSFPLRWGDHNDPEQGEPTSPPPELEYSPNDSGLGTSVASSSSEKRSSTKRGKKI